MATWYVATDGNDSNPGTLAQPFLTPYRASQISAGPGPGDTVIFRGGTYPITNRLDFGSTHSGQTWKPYPGETVIFDGGTAITGWTCDDVANDRWVADYTSTFFRHLYANGLRVNQHMTSGSDVGSGWTGVPTKPTAAGTGWTNTSSSWSVTTAEKNPTKICLVYRYSWMMSRIPIASIPANNQITPNAQAWTNMVTRVDFHSWNRWPQHIENSWTWFSDATYGRQRGTHYYDVAAGKVYVYRPLDVDMSTATIKAAVFDGPMISLNGTSDITFRDIIFRHNQWSRPTSNEGFVDDQAATLLDSTYPTLPGNPHGAGTQSASAIEIRDSNRITVEGCTLEHLGTGGITINGASQDCVIRGNVIRDLSANGIQIGSPNEPNPTTPVTGTLISNNVVRYCGQEHWGAVCYIEYYPKNTVCEHNDFGYSNYSVTSRGWGWGGTGTTTNKRDGNVFRYNHIHHGMMKTATATQIGDGGNQYENGRATNDTCLGNVVRVMTNTLGRGIYTDDECSNRTFTDYVTENLVNTVPEWQFAHNNSTGNSFTNVFCDNDDVGQLGGTTPTYTSINQVTDPYIDGAQIVKMAGLEAAYRHLDDNWEPRAATRAGRNFSGADGRLTKTSFPDITNEGTISFWLLPEWSSGAGDTKVLFNFSNAADNDWILLQRYWNSGSNWTLGVYYNGAESNSTADTGMFAAFKPVQVTMTWSGAAGNIKVYISNKLVLTYTRTVADMAINKLILGNYTSAIANKSAGGRMFDVGLWNVRLTDAEIASLTALHPSQVRRAALTDVWNITNAAPEANLITAGNSLTASGTTAGVADVPTTGGQPTVPNTLAVTAPSETVLRLAWAASSSVQTPTYKIYKSATRWDGFTLVTSQAGLTLDNLTPGYWYSVSASNDAGESGLSPPVLAEAAFDGGGDEETVISAAKARRLTMHSNRGSEGMTVVTGFASGAQPSAPALLTLALSGRDPKTVIEALNSGTGWAFHELGSGTSRPMAVQLALAAADTVGDAATAAETLYGVYSGAKGMIVLEPIADVVHTYSSGAGVEVSQDGVSAKLPASTAATASASLAERGLGVRDALTRPAAVEVDVDDRWIGIARRIGRATGSVAVYPACKRLW